MRAIVQPDPSPSTPSSTEATPQSAGASVPAEGAAAAPAPRSAASASAASSLRGAFILAGGLIVILSAIALALAWSAQQRVKVMEQQLVARQQQSQTEAGEALVTAKAAQDAGREASAKVALLEARLAEVALQRSQLEELIQSLSRSREENVLADLEAAIRVAQQQSALTGSSEPLINTLRQADERLARFNSPRLDRVRRAVLRDLDRVRAVGQVDLPALAVRLDEVVRQIDDLPVLGNAAPTPAPSATAAATAAAASAATPATPAAATASAATAPFAAASSANPAPKPLAETGVVPGWASRISSLTLEALQRVWHEVRSLVRITRIDNPEAVLASPDQVFFLRENIKLRLINARLALLSRQFDVAQSDMREAQMALERYFDSGSRRVALTLDALKQVSRQARQINLPRPDETLAVLAAVNTGR